MTPTSLVKPCTSTPTLPELTDRHATLATLPLLFSAQGNCTNKAVMAAIIDALSDKSLPDQTIASIFKNAWQHHYQIQLNALITRIETQHGPGTVQVNEQVLRLLADAQISLLQNRNGTVQMEQTIALKPDLQRHDLIHTAFEKILPTSLCRLISSYDDDIEISAKNKDAIVAIFDSADPAAKSAVIAAAVHQHQIAYLNVLFKQQLVQQKPLNLSHVDVNHLNLAGIDLTQANLSFANLQGCCLIGAHLQNALLTAANLNRADLSRANLAYGNLSQARLIAANLSKANLRGAILPYACLLCANLEAAELGYNMDLTLAVINFSNIGNGVGAVFGLWRQKIHTPIDAIVVPQRSGASSSTYFAPVSGSVVNPPSGHRISASRSTTIVIDENEKRILLARGIVMQDRETGIIQLSRGVIVRQDAQRHLKIDSALSQILPKELTDIISSYDDDIEISQDNESAIRAILKSGDQTAKALLIGSASRQGSITFLNQLLINLREQNFKLDFSNINLSNLDLSGINLNNINLRHAVLHGCNLYQATLQHTNLSFANLNGASLVATNFNQADLQGARLFQADLTRAVLTQVTLAGAVLKFANLLGADLSGGTDLTGAYLDHAELELTDLTGAVMINVSLTKANMFGTKLGRANLTNAKLMAAKLALVSLHSVNLTHADLSGATLVGISLTDAPQLAGTIWTNVVASKIITDPDTRARLPFFIRSDCI